MALKKQYANYNKEHDHLSLVSQIQIFKLDDIQMRFWMTGTISIDPSSGRIVKTFMLKLHENSDIGQIYCIRQPKIT
ncbi:hypothetical protein BpHYR1_033688 [Brachionus plicatilis]|uniref:Uncharacterized protein n=1 Tax=Brachionus plicatilis TaxID=10195 RepID=A0A3M7Q7I5_BRAPC|nr:hypothetical protein BpHYR1_033688 [Brachionus plicatilis]